MANSLTVLIAFPFRYTLYKMGNVLSASSNDKMPLSPFQFMWSNKRERAKSSKYTTGEASDFCLTEIVLEHSSIDFDILPMTRHGVLK
jgi:hypothetical protein